MTKKQLEARHTKLLDGINVLDLSEGIAGPFCAKLLADLGANTVKVERPDQGDMSRSLGPFPDGRADIEKSASFFYFNTGKRSAVLDVDSEIGKATLKKLVQQYDVVVASDTDEGLRERGLGFEELRSWNPGVILTTVSGFGSFGPLSNYESSHLITCAVGGWTQLCGVPEREPLQVGGAITQTLTGAYAAAATLLAAFGRSHHGGGEHIDVSAQEAAICGASIPSLIYEYSGVVAERYSSVGSGAGACYMLPTREGYIGLNALTRSQWHMLCKFVGLEEVAEDPKYAGLSWVKPDERLEEVRAMFSEALKDKTAEELFHEAQKWRVPFGLVPSLEELFQLPPHLERNFFQSVDHPECGSVKLP
ncbi:MAG: CoA transferase, partial [Pseudomonadota bacterium]|nr:CoA transferase [Pseudomonadota bacterium]